MDSYDRVFEILTDAMKAVGNNNISKAEMLPALIDFTTAIALIIAREDGARAMIIRIEGRIDDWKAGRFPASGKATQIH
jgi:hypothetical protein